MIKCPKCGRFCRSHAYSGQGSEELEWVTCSVHGSWSEAY